MTRPTTDILVLLFAFAVGKWELLLACAVILAIDEWRHFKVEQHARSAKEKAEYRDFSDGYELGWVQADLSVLSEKTAVPSEGTRRLSAPEMAARHWASTVGRANWQGYGRGYADRTSAKDLTNSDRQHKLKIAWGEYKA